MMVIVMMAMLTMMLMMMLRMPIYSTILYYTTVVMVMMMTESALHWLVSIRYCAAVPLELSAMLRSRHTSTMAGLGNMVRARAELASWPQFAGHFEAEEAMVEEGKTARKAKAKAKAEAKAQAWPKRTPEEEAEKKRRQRAKRAVKWPAEVAAEKEEAARKRREARAAETVEQRDTRLETRRRKKAERWVAMNPYQKAAVQEGKAAARRRWKKGVVVKARQRRWQELTEHSAVVELGALHTMAARQARLATLREGRKRRSAVGGGLEADGGWAVEHVPPTGTRGRGGGTELVRRNTGGHGWVNPGDKEVQVPHEWVNPGPGGAPVFVLLLCAG